MYELPPHTKINFVVRSAIILLAETVLFAFPNTLGWWILRIVLLLIIWSSYSVLYHRTNWSNVDLAPAMLYINVVYILAMLNTRFEFLPGFVTFILCLLMVNFYWYVFRQIERHRILIDAGLDPLYDNLDFGKIVRDFTDKEFEELVNDFGVNKLGEEERKIERSRT